MSIGRWIGVDLDGTLARHYWPEDGPYEHTRIGEPIPKMVERVKLWIAKGIEVRIFTARVGPLSPDVILRTCAARDATGRWFIHSRHDRYFETEEACSRCGFVSPNRHAREAIKEWCLQYIGIALRVTATKDYGMIQLWDDRAVQIIHNTGERADGAA